MARALHLVPKSPPPPASVIVPITPAMRACMAALKAQVGEIERAFNGASSMSAAMDRAVLLLERVPGLAADLHNAVGERV